MACLFEGNRAAAHHLGAAAVHFVAQLRAGEDDIQMDENIVVVDDGFPGRGGLGREGHQNPFDFLLLPGFQFLQLVVGLHHAHRLDEQRCAGGGDVVYKTGEGGLVLRLHRHNEASVALGDECFLQHLGVGGGGDDFLQNLAAFGGGDAHLAANVAQLRAGAVGDALLIEDGAVDFILQVAVGVDGGEEAVNTGGLSLALGIVFLYAAGGGQHPCNIQQLAGVQHAALVSALQGRCHIFHACEIGCAVKLHPLLGGIRFVQQAHHIVAVGGGEGAEALLPRRLADSAGRQLGKDGG